MSADGLHRVLDGGRASPPSSSLRLEFAVAVHSGRALPLHEVAERLGGDEAGEATIDPLRPFRVPRPNIPNAGRLTIPPEAIVVAMASRKNVTKRVALSTEIPNLRAEAEMTTSESLA